MKKRKKILSFVLLFALLFSLLSTIDFIETKAFIADPLWEPSFYYTECYNEIRFNKVKPSGASATIGELDSDYSLNMIVNESNMCHEYLYGYHEFTLDQNVAASIVLDNLTQIIDYDIHLYKINNGNIQQIASAISPYTFIDDEINMTLTPGHYYLVIEIQDRTSTYFNASSSNDFRVIYNFYPTGNPNKWHETNSTIDYNSFSNNTEVLSSLSQQYLNLFMQEIDSGWTTDGPNYKHVQILEYENKLVFDQLNQDDRLYYETVVGILYFEDSSDYLIFQEGQMGYNHTVYLLDKTTEIQFARLRIRQEAVRSAAHIPDNLGMPSYTEPQGSVDIELIDNVVLEYDWNFNTLSYIREANKNDITITNLQSVASVKDVDDPTNEMRNDNTFNYISTDSKYYNEDDDITIVHNYYHDAFDSNIQSVVNHGWEHVIKQVPGVNNIYSAVKSVREFTDPWVEAYQNTTIRQYEVSSYTPITNNHQTFGMPNQSYDPLNDPYNLGDGAQRVVGTFMSDDEGYLLTAISNPIMTENYLRFNYDLFVTDPYNTGFRPTDVYVSTVGSFETGNRKFDLFNYPDTNADYYNRLVYRTGYTNYYTINGLDSDKFLNIELEYDPDNVSKVIKVFEKTNNGYELLESSTTSIQNMFFDAYKTYFVAVEYTGLVTGDYSDGRLTFTEVIQSLNKPIVTISNITDYSAQVTYTNPNSHEVDLYRKLGSSNYVFVTTLAPNATYTETLSLPFGSTTALYSKLVHSSGVESSYTYKSITTDGRPTITTINVSNTFVKYKYTNNSSQTVKVYAEIGDSTPDIIKCTLAPGQSCYVTFSGLTPDTLYTFYVRFRTLSGQYSQSTGRTVRTTGGDIWFEQF